MLTFNVCYTLGMMGVGGRVTEESINHLITELGVIDDNNSLDVDQYTKWFLTAFAAAVP